MLVLGSVSVTIYIKFTQHQDHSSFPSRKKNRQRQEDVGPFDDLSKHGKHSRESAVCFVFFRGALPKTNIAPKRGGFHFPGVYFQGLCDSFREGTPRKIIM